MSFRITPDRRHTLRGRENLAWFFANRKWVRGIAGGSRVAGGLASGAPIVECAWATRPLPEGEAGILFLLLATKRSYKRAHDRNKIKRWLRAAITEAALFTEIEATVLARQEQLLIMMRISKPIREVEWGEILEATQMIAEHLKKRV